MNGYILTPSITWLYWYSVSKSSEYIGGSWSSYSHRSSDICIGFFLIVVVAVLIMTKKNTIREWLR